MFGHMVTPAPRLLAKALRMPPRRFTRVPVAPWVPSWGRPGGYLGRIVGLMGRLGAILGRLGALFGGLSGRLGAILAASWA
eukprot:103112-Pyramimonas_sp.AAC.1